MNTIIISGFLGAGKTELLKNIIRQNPGKKIAVIENEVAEFGIDGKIASSEQVQVVEINDGSIASVNLRSLKKVLRTFSRNHLLIIETSGAANLEPVVSVLLESGRKPYVITVIDAERFARAEKLSTHTLGHIEYASIVLLNKCDLITESQKSLQLRNIRMLNRNCWPCTLCNIDIHALLSQASPITSAPKPKSASYISWKIKNNLGLTSAEERHQNINAYVYRSHGQVNLDQFKRLLFAWNLPRVKGFIWLDRLYYFNFVSGHFSVELAPRQSLQPNIVVLIGENIFHKRNLLKKKLDACINKTPSNHIQDALMFLRNQQTLPERINYIRHEPLSH